MNEKTAYETIIADKLTQRKVPDLKDAIWSRINNELDLDMPEGNDEPPQTPKPNKPLRWSVKGKAEIFMALVAVISITIFLLKKPSAKLNNYSKQPPQQSVTPAPADIINNLPPERLATPEKPTQKSVTVPNVLPDTGTSVVNTPALPLAMPQQPIQDSIINKIPPPLVVSKPPPDTIPVKKSKGFKGISDNDYKISLKNDSVP